VNGALRYRDFRLFWVSLLVSNAGAWLQVVAQDYLVYKLTGRALDLGIVDGVRALALITLPFFGGVVADRVDKRKLLMLTQMLFAAAAALLGFLVASGLVRVWHDVAISLFTAIVLAFDQPARQSLLPRLVPRSALTNAIALNSVSYTGAAALGPALAGPLVALVGLAWAFWINAASYFLVVFAVWRISADTTPHAEQRETSARHAVASGVKYVASQPMILYLAAMLAIFSVLAIPYQTLMPVFNDRSFHGDVTTLGWLRAAVGVGSLLGGIGMALHAATGAHGVSRKRALFVVAAGLAFAGALVTFALQSALVGGLAMLLLAGCAWTLFQSNVQTLMQHLAEERMRGRVMSLFAVSVIGAWQLGAFPMGWAADRFGAARALVAGCALAIALGLALTWTVRRRLRELG